MRKTEIFRNADDLRVEPYRRQGYFASVDALRFLRGLRDDVADVMFMDPPFNLGKDYGFASKLELSRSDWYHAYMALVVREGGRVLKPGGALFLYHLPYWASRLSSVLQQELQFRHWIAIAMKNGFVRGRRLYPAHYALLYYTKDEPRHFHRPRLLPQRCRHCGELVKNYGGYTSIITRKGINLSDFWDDLSPVRHAARKHRSANQLPRDLTDRVIAIAGRRDGLLVDPFAGSGTSLVSAAAGGMFFVGNDLARSNHRIWRNRLAESD